MDVGNVTNKSVGGLNPSMTYYYRVRAYNAGGTSGNSGTITVTTSPATRPTLGYVAQGNNLILTWATNDPAFVLEYAANLTATLRISNTVAPAIVSGQYTVTNRMTNEFGFYRLKR